MISSNFKVKKMEVMWLIWNPLLSRSPVSYSLIFLQYLQYPKSKMHPEHHIWMLWLFLILVNYFECWCLFWMQNSNSQLIIFHEQKWTGFYFLFFLSFFFQLTIVSWKGWSKSAFSNCSDKVRIQNTFLVLGLKEEFTSKSNSEC